jgi:SAM-dependent methyltransferase
MSIDTSSLERLVPDEVARGDATGDETLRLHLERYGFAARHARPGRFLDLACGVGYGTRLVADANDTIESALGVDLSESAVRYATDRYARAGIEYRHGDGVRFADPAGFDTIVSLETIEHVPDPQALVGNLVSLLRPGAVLVASVPTTPSADVNPHHLHDFTEASFRAMFTRHGLRELEAFQQVQPYKVFRILRKQEQRAEDLRPNLVGWYLSHPMAALTRVLATLRWGFTNRYITIVWRAPGP